MPAREAIGDGSLSSQIGQIDVATTARRSIRTDVEGEARDRAWGHGSARRALSATRRDVEGLV